MIKNENPTYIKVLIRYLKEHHCFREYIKIMNNDFNYKHYFDCFDDLKSFIVKMMYDTNVNWGYEYNMLLCDSDLFINKKFKITHDFKLDNYIDLFHVLYPKLYEEIS